MTVLSPAGSRHKSTELAAALHTTPGFVAHVVNPLVKAGWVRSLPGPSGGYELTADGLSALDVIEAVDGPTANGDCVLEDRPCMAIRACVLHEAWRAARAVLTRELATTPAATCDREAFSAPTPTATPRPDPPDPGDPR